MGHMFCDPGCEGQLHAVASQIGLKRAWFQDKPRHPHYDITDRYRRAAIRAGAIDLPDMHAEGEVHELHAEWRRALTSGRVYDIRSGRAIGRTKSLNETFLRYVEGLMKNDMEFYIVFGRCQHYEVRTLVSYFQSLESLKVIFDARMGPDIVLIFEGDPSELGYTA